MKNVNYKRVYVATYKEIVAIFFIFLIVLAILYPRDTILHQVLLENSNYDLSVIYIKNMLKNQPHNEKLILALIRKSYDRGKRDFAYKLLKLVENSSNHNIRQEAYRIKYLIEKEKYYYFKQKNRDKKAKKMYMILIDTFRTILGEHLYDKNDLRYLYKEAFFLNDIKLEYFLAKKMIKLYPRSIKLLKDVYYFSYKLDKLNEALLYANILSKKDRFEKIKWLKAKYDIMSQLYNYEKLYKFLLKNAKTSKFWQKMLIDFYIRHKQYSKAADFVMRQFKNSFGFEIKMRLWLKAIKILVSGNKLKKAVSLAYKYQDKFFKSERARVEILKLYMMAGDVKKARELSLKIIQRIKW